jgi:hypothetical protein
MLGDAVGGRAEQVVAQEVAAMAEHNEVVTAGGCKLRDHFRGVAGTQLDVEIEPRAGGLLLCLVCERREEAVFLALDLVDLADRRRVCGQRPLNREGGHTRTDKRGELQGLREGAVRALGPVDRNEDALERQLHHLRFCRSRAGDRLRRRRTVTFELRLHVRLEEALRDRGRDDRGQDDDRDQE